jgi:hypothetical protein
MTSWVIARSRQATKQSIAMIGSDIMIKDQVKAVLERVPTWPEDRQQELAEVALEIEAELAGAEYEATPEELAAIDEGLSGEAASDDEVEAAFALFKKG